MALTLEAALKVKQKALAHTRNPSTQNLLRTFFSYWANHKGNADLQYVPITGLDSADCVIADVACKLHVLFLKKPAASTVDAWAKVSDHATVAAAAGDIVEKFIGTGGGGQELCGVWPDGLKLGTGAKAGCHTAVDGNTDSASADAAVGFAIVGAA